MLFNQHGKNDPYIQSSIITQMVPDSCISRSHKIDLRGENFTCLKPQ